MSEGKYLVQCISGDQNHIFVATPGSDMEKRCIEREKKGKLDALTLGTDECESCKEEQRDHEGRAARFYDMFPDPFELDERPARRVGSTDRS